MCAHNIYNNNNIIIDNAIIEQGQNLPDEERRKLAAKVALSFAAQLGV